MPRLCRLLVVVATSLALVACTTTRIVAQGPEASAEALRRSPALGDPKDRLFVVLRDGTRHEIRPTAVDGEALLGTTLDGRTRMRLVLAEIERVEVVEVDTRAILIGVGLTLLVLGLAARSAAKSIVDGLPKAALP